MAAALVAAVPALFHAQGGSYHVIKTTLIGGEGGWDYVTVDPDAQRIYIPRGTHVQVLDESTHKVVADIPGMKGIHGVAVAPDANRGFVTGNDPKGVIYVFDLKTNKVTSTIPTGEEDCDGIMYDPATKRVYVNNGDSMTTTVIDPAAAKVVGHDQVQRPARSGSVRRQRDALRQPGRQRRNCRSRCEEDDGQDDVAGRSRASAATARPSTRHIAGCSSHARVRCRLAS